ncbi:MAG: hypothetical protein O3A85_03325 [Proteobacteria bacterium]|nr:hypothetical protein [Pseudomonadota bacterium]
MADATEKRLAAPGGGFAGGFGGGVENGNDASFPGAGGGVTL